MITVAKKEIQISPFQVLHKEQTNRRTENADYFLDMGAGINVSVDVNIEDVSEGMIFIEQVCNSHKLFFKKDSGDECTFQLPRPCYDSRNETDRHYRKFKVIDNKIVEGYNSVHFYDTLFTALERHWKEFHYVINFQVWFQYQVKDVKLVPLCKFEWCMLAHCAFTDGIWVLTQNASSTEAEVTESFKILYPEDNPVDVSSMDHLASTVSKFKEENGLWPPKPQNSQPRI